MEGRGRGEGPAEPGPGQAAGRPPAAPYLALFDLDGTLVVGQTQRLLVSFLRRRRLVSRRFQLGTFLWFAGYKVGLLSATDQARARGAQLFAGSGLDEVQGLMLEFVEEEMTPRLYAPALRALERHLAAGDRVVLLSAAFEPLVAALAARLKMADYLATPLEVEQRRYTGRLAGPALYGERKAQAAAALMAATGLQPERCLAYADHESDLPLLESVGRPVVVRPDAALRALARERGWGRLSDE
jgi:HAD superfamily hydrolase (TIGR01490 family)